MKLIKEIVKVPDAGGYIGTYPEIENTTEVSTVLDTIDKRDASDELTSEVQIDSIVDNGAIDEFNEQINPSEIDLNP